MHIFIDFRFVRYIIVILIIKYSAVLCFIFSSKIIEITQLRNICENKMICYIWYIIISKDKNLNRLLYHKYNKSIDLILIFKFYLPSIILLVLITKYKLLFCYGITVIYKLIFYLLHLIMQNRIFSLIQ